MTEKPDIDPCHQNYTHRSQFPAANRTPFFAVTGLRAHRQKDTQTNPNQGYFMLATYIYENALCQTLKCDCRHPERSRRVAATIAKVEVYSTDCDHARPNSSRLRGQAPGDQLSWFITDDDRELKERKITHIKPNSTSIILTDTKKRGTIPIPYISLVRNQVPRKNRGPRLAPSPALDSYDAIVNSTCGMPP